MQQQMVQKHKVVIIGSGFSGLCLGIKLKQAGIHDFVILEKADSLGGTWRENSYPGAECDIPSALYSYSFESNPNWTYKWSERNQILQYQQATAAKYGLTEHFRFKQKVTSARFQKEGNTWLISSESGEQYRAQHLISAVGQLHERFTPQFDNFEQFQGHSFHSAKWNHDVDLSGKRIAVIGNAASAVQLVPEVAKTAAQLTVFQRSPNWQLPKPDREYTALEKWLSKHIPPLRKLYRLGLWLQGELLLFPAIKKDGLARKIVQARATKNLNDNIECPELRKKLTPDYPFGAKRALFSHTYYQALNRENVALETNHIQQFTSTGIKTQDGREQQFDVVIFATGFITNPFLKSIEVIGVEDNSLEDSWSSGAQAYLGINTSGFPNLHMMYGPNTNLGHNSIIAMIEAQSAYIVDAVQHLDANALSVMEVNKSAETEFNAELQKRLAAMAFSGIENSWYMDRGKITNNWAGTATEYQKRLKSVDWNAYSVA